MYERWVAPIDVLAERQSTVMTKRLSGVVWSGVGEDVANTVAMSDTFRPHSPSALIELSKHACLFNAAGTPRTATESVAVQRIPLTVRPSSDDTRIAAIEQDPPLLWSQTDDRQLKSPSRQLLEQIAAGELDEHLVAIADAVHARRELLHTVRAAAAIAELCVGDAVVFTSRIRPRYLAHELAVIEELDDHWVTVRLWRPVGRFRDGTLRCPPLALRKVAPQP